MFATEAASFLDGVMVMAIGAALFAISALKKLGVSTILHPMRNAVDHAVDALTAIIRPQQDKT